MEKKKVSQEQLRKLIMDEIGKNDRCDGIDRVSFYRVEEPGAGNWTVSFIGGLPGSEAATAMTDILQRLTAEYDVAWEARH